MHRNGIFMKGKADHYDWLFGSTRRGTFQPDVIVHYSLERALASGLCEKEYIISIDELVSGYIDAIQPVEPVNSMPRD